MIPNLTSVSLLKLCALSGYPIYRECTVETLYIYNNFAGKRAETRCQKFIVLYKLNGNVDPLYCPSVLLPIRYTSHPTYDNCL